MNPYAARLVGMDDIWPGWWPEPSIAWRFLEMARPGPRPQAKWIVQVEERSRGLITGDP